MEFALKGLKIQEYFGNFYMKNNTDVELSILDSEKAIGVMIKHDGKMETPGESSFQLALLYTTSSGMRRVRVHNLMVPNTNKMTDVFRMADLQTICNILTRNGKASTGF